MDIVTDAFAFIKAFEQIYFEKRDLDAVITMLDQDIIWVDAGKGEICRGLSQVKTRMQMEKDAHYHSFIVLQSQYDVIPLSEKSCCISGEIELRENAAYSLLMNLRLRITAVCRMRDNGAKLCHMHLSHPSRLQAEGEFFPRALIQESNRQLYALVEEKSKEIEQRSRDLKVLIDNIPGGMFRCLNDEKLTIVQANEGFLSMFGYDDADLKTILHNSFFEMLDPRDRVSSRLEVERQMAIGTCKELEYRVLCKDGSSLWVLDKGQLLKEADGQESFCCILVDITNAKKAQEQLRLSLERHKIIMNQTNDILFEWEIASDLITISANWEKKFGYRPIDKEVKQLFGENSPIHEEDRKQCLSVLQEILQGREYVETECRIRDKDNRYSWCRIRSTTQYEGDKKPIKAVGVIIDIDHEKRRSQRLIEKAEQDALTGLYNKSATQSMIQNYLSACPVQEVSALFIIDIDNFKKINDTMGHLFGDAVLADVAREIKKQFRSTDIIGRIGGDEFLALVKKIPDAAFAVKKSKKVIEAFRQISKGSTGGREGLVSCSIGIALYPFHSCQFEKLYHCADCALYHAKKQGKNRCVLYENTLMQESVGNISDTMQTTVNEHIDSNENSKALGSRLIEYVFRILYKSIDVEAAIQPIIEIVGKQLDVSRVYIFENAEDNLTCSNTFEWCNMGVPPEIQNLQNISYQTDMDGYRHNFDVDGIFYCKDICTLPARQRTILEAQNIKSVLQCEIRDEGVYRGFVGFDECRVNRYWTREQIDVLSFIAEILSTFLLKKRAHERVQELANGMHAMLDEQNVWIYLIDPADYKLLFLNRKTKELVPDARVGKTCHEIFFCREKPCEHCPARSLLQTSESCTMEIYNPILRVWSAASASLVQWAGEDAIMLCCHDISRYKA